MIKYSPQKSRFLDQIKRGIVLASPRGEGRGDLGLKNSPGPSKAGRTPQAPAKRCRQRRVRRRRREGSGGFGRAGDRDG